MIFKQEQFDPPPILSSWTQGLRALQFTRKYYARSHTTSTVVLLFMRGSSTCPALRWMDVIPAMSFLLRYKINACTHGCLCMHGENTEQKCSVDYHSEHRAEYFSLWSFCRWMSSTTWTKLLIPTICWILSSLYTEAIIYPQSCLATAWQAPITALVCNKSFGFILLGRDVYFLIFC